MEDSNDQTYVKLISAEGSEIYLEKRIALQVDTMKRMLEGNFRESEESVIRFPDISGAALENVVKYLHYKDRHASSTSRIPEFPIHPEEVRYYYVASQCLFVCLDDAFLVSFDCWSLTRQTIGWAHSPSLPIFYFKIIILPSKTNFHFIVYFVSPIRRWN